MQLLKNIKELKIMLCFRFKNILIITLKNKVLVELKYTYSFLENLRQIYFHERKTKFIIESNS